MDGLVDRQTDRLGVNMRTPVEDLKYGYVHVKLTLFLFLFLLLFHFIFPLRFKIIIYQHKVLFIGE